MLKQKTILMIDDEEAICFAFQRFFSRRGAKVLIAGNLEDGLRLCAQAELLFLDIRLGRSDGLEALPEIKRLYPALPVVIMTAYGSLDKVAKAMQYGAFDYVIKPLDMNRAEALAMQALARPGKNDPNISVPEFAGFVGNSVQMQTLLLQLLRYAQSDQAILLSGETGTGKELAAHFLHTRGKRAKGPFVSVNCGALPENLVESELFGHSKGTFTGAVQDKTGLCEAADKGILFLDEIGELPLSAQVKLLRFLDRGQVDKLGGIKPVQLDVQVISASNRDLRKAVKEGIFRADLYYRLTVLRVELPPLREHREDIPALAKYWLEQLKTSSAQPVLSAEAEEILLNWAWPGNVRELRNVVLQAAASVQGKIILPSDLPSELRKSPLSKVEASQQKLLEYVNSLVLNGDNCLQKALFEFQNLLIERALQECDRNQSAAAAKLGIHRNSLRRLQDREEKNEDLN
ncbi:MAG: sigma-54 dependent transcriptional regulator [Lentisphaeria bacterium]